VGVGRANVSLTNISDFKIPLPPLPEQHRIVAKIEELFTRLGAGVEALKQAQAQLKRYRQSVLKAAVEGRLTAEWREQHLDELEPADKLLERIQKERKAKLGKKYKEPMPVDASYLPELPEEWSVSSVGILYDIIGGGTPSTKVGEYWDGDNPWLTSADISDKGKISPRKSITQEGIENSATNLVPKNSLIVVTRVGLGKVALTDFPLCFSQDSQALVGSENYINPKFAFYYLLRTVQTFKYRSRGTTISGVTKKQLFELPFSIPPYQEQQEITNRIERIYSAIDASELIIISELKRAQSLRQSILKRAFEGKLAPQDPNDLPAPRPGKYYIYVLECSNGSYYIGQTENIEKRWCDHAGGRGADWTKKYPPLALVHWEEYNTRADTAKREKELKTGFGRKWIKREIKAGRARQAGEPASVLLEKIKAKKTEPKKSKQMEIF